MKLQIKKEELDPWEVYKGLDKSIISHCENVANYTYILYGLALKENLYSDELSAAKLLHIKNSVIYHDIGKSLVSPTLLNKKDALTDVERAELKNHVVYGLNIFKDVLKTYHSCQATANFLDNAVQSIMHHHERFDGMGYPNGLNGHDISALGRICSIADYYDALTSVRPYRMALPHEYVVLDMKAQSGKMFDPNLVRIFLDNHKLFKNQAKFVCRKGGTDESIDGNDD